MAMKVVSIKTEKVLDTEKTKGMKVVNFTTEKVVDTNPNIYLERAEEMLKKEQFNEALKEAELAVEYSNYDERYILQCNKIKNAIAERYLTIANKAINEGYFTRAIEQCNKIKSMKDIFYDYISKADAIIKRANNNIEKRKTADSYLNNANSMIRNGIYNEAISEAQKALNYMYTKEYIDKVESVKRTVDYKLKEIEAESYIKNAKEYMNNKNYYETLEIANKALECSNGTELLNKYLEIYNKIEDNIKNADKEDIINLGDKYYEHGNLDEAIQWYKVADNAKALYKIGKIEFFNKSNTKLGVDFLEKSGNCGNEDAFIELLNIFTEGKHVKRKLRKVKHYYMGLKLINRKLAKQTLKDLKVKYNLSLRKRLIITGRIKFINYIVLFFIIFVLGYSSVMFYDGSWRGYVKDASFSVNNNTLAINEEGKCTASYNVIPFFANNKLYKIVPENSSIVEVNGDNFKALAEGTSNLIFYINDKEFKREEITVYKPRVEEFDIYFDDKSTLNKVGDSITPKLNIKYLNDKKMDNLDPIFISNDPNVVRVEGTVLIARGSGHATVIVKVGDITKDLNFDIKEDNNARNNNTRNNNTRNNNEYIFKDTDKIYLPYDYLKNTDVNTLKFLMNEILARHGLILKDEPYKSYFESKSWYKGTKQVITEDMVNEFEKINIRLIQSRINTSN